MKAFLIKGRVYILILAAIFQLLSIVLDQVIISIDGKIQKLEFIIDDRQTSIFELEFKNEILFKEWESLRHSIDLFTSNGNATVRDYLHQAEFSEYLLDITSNVNSERLKADNPKLALAIMKIHEQTKHLEEIADPVERILATDTYLIKLSQQLTNSISALRQRNKLDSNLETSLTLNRHIAILVSVAAQILGLLLLVVFLIIEYKRYEQKHFNGPNE